MPEAVIVSAARSPIGRAFKGSLKDLRPDDLTATIVRAALDKIPELDPTRHRRPLPRLRPARRRERLQHGPDRRRCCWATTTCPARRSRATARRRCRPPGWRSTRSRPARATCSSPPASRRSRGSPRATPTACPDTMNPVFADAGPAPASSPRAAQDWHDPREHGAAPRRLHRDGPDRRERRPAARALPPGARRVRRAQPEPRREGDRRRLLGARDHPGDHAGRHRGQRRRRPARRRHAGGGQRPQAGVPSRRRGHGRQLLRAQRRRRRGGGDVRHQGRRARPHPAGPDRLHRRHRPVPRDHGPRPGRGDQAGAGRART